MRRNECAGHKLKSFRWSHWITATAIVAGSVTGVAQTTKAAAERVTSPATKPAWLTDLSLGVKESYDDNVFLSDVGPTAHEHSWITTVSPKFGVNLAPLTGCSSLQALSFGYAPDFNLYHNEDSETYFAHRTALTLKGKTRALSYSMENGFNYVDGDEDGPIYLSGRSAYATSAARERREQFQDRAKIMFQYDVGHVFVRPNATLLYYDLLTNVRAPKGAWKGYDNYADRYDVNGGIDFGYRVTKQVAATLGYRYGHQYQQQYPTAVDPEHLSSPSDYHRALLGLEGKPVKWLTMSVQAGPDFRTYEEDSETHKTPVRDHHPVKYYGEATVAAEVSKQDSIGLKYRQWQWVSSTGKIPYFDSNYELSWKHKFSKKLQFEVGGRIQGSDYNSASVATGNRNDMQYGISTSVSYGITDNLSASAGYLLELGRNAQDDLPRAAIDSREYEHQVFMLGLGYKF